MNLISSLKVAKTDVYTQGIAQLEYMKEMMSKLRSISNYNCKGNVTFYQDVLSYFFTIYFEIKVKDHILAHSIGLGVKNGP